MSSNVTHTIDSKTGELIIRCKISDATIKAAPDSASGKTKLIASTHGNAHVTLPNGQPAMFSINVMVRN